MHRLLTVRLAAWRARHLLRILLAAVILGASVRLAAPPAPPSVAVAVASRTVPAGRTLTAADVRLARRPASAVPAEAAATVDEAVGRRAAVALPEGLALVPSMFASGRFATQPPPGSVVVPVMLGGSEALRVGDTVEVVADLGCGDGDGPIVVSALVVGLGASSPAGAVDPDTTDGEALGDGWGLGTAGTSGTNNDDTVLIAVTPENGRKIAGIVDICRLNGVIVP